MLTEIEARVEGAFNVDLAFFRCLKVQRLAIKHILSTQCIKLHHTNANEPTKYSKYA